MRFKSTRGGGRTVSFEEAIAQGYACDGGLYVPEELPRLSLWQLDRWRALSFPALAEAVLRLFVGSELEPLAELAKLIHACYTDFSSPEVVPVKRVGGVLVAELFHGPTLCFKDLGQQPMVRLLAAFAERRGRRHCVLVSTTGDTGPAVMRAVGDSGSRLLDLLVFFPEGQISELQRRQMTTVPSRAARVAAFEGGGDDMDAPLKRLAADRKFARRHGLCGLNSYNLGRPLAQMVHFFWCYFRALDKSGLQVGDSIDVVLPAGALGNLAAGYMAKEMGLPIRRLVAATNANDITHRTFAFGRFHRSETMHKTLSDAINIQVPYNMERIFYYLTGEDSALGSEWMGAMAAGGRLTLPEPWVKKLQETFSSRSVSDSSTSRALRESFERHGYLADPHTAVALAAAWDIYGQEPVADRPPVVVLATASPCKFEAAISEVLGPEVWARYAASPEFPAAARAVLVAPELPFARLAASGTLDESQSAWEERIRGWLDGSRSKL